MPSARIPELSYKLDLASAPDGKDRNNVSAETVGFRLFEQGVFYQKVSIIASVYEWCSILSLARSLTILPLRHNVDIRSLLLP